MAGNDENATKKKIWYKSEHGSRTYNARRICQVFASKIIPPAMLSKIYYRIVLKKKLNLKHPETFNEKLQWLKLYRYPQNELVVQCADKYGVREFVTEKGYGHTLVPLLGTWTDARDIDWEKLPPQFVLKCNHGSAYNILCLDKEKLDKKKAIRQLNAWLKEDFGAFNLELHYSKIKQHLVTCEECLGDKIYDYKFFCFNGEPQFFYISYNFIEDSEAEVGFFNLDGSKMSLRRNDYKSIETIEIPPFFDEMKAMAKDLCRDFPFVRVDFFIANNTFYFAELTFIPCAGMMPFNPPECDLEWGKMLDITAR